ncbi:MAG: anti-sigma factor antagonist, partial [Anaerolineae bacterium]|nr:anti-sigma factor antagonist [Anaerolineae bacterium]
PDRFTIRITDDGPIFDPTAQTDPNPDSPLAEREPGGWGIFFIKKMMDVVRYDLDTGQNRLTIAKLKTPETLAAPVTDEPSDADNVQQLAADVWEISPPSRRLDSNSAPALASLFDRQVEAGRFKLLVNMADVDYISTSGLKVLVNAWRTMQSNSGQVVLAAMNTHVLEVFETVGFDQIFSIHTTVDDALRQFVELDA